MGKLGFPFGGLNLPMLSGISLGTGNLFIVANTQDTYAYQSARTRFGKLRNEDNTPVLYFHNATASVVTNDGIAEALANCKANRGDTVLILPSSGSYYVSSALSVAVETVRVIGLGAGNVPYGCDKAVRLNQITDATAVMNVSANYCEIAGLWIKNYYSHESVILAAAQATNLHHCYFALQHTGGTNAPAIKGTTTGGAWGQIHHNWLISQAGNSATCAALILIDAAATSTVVSHNMITCGDGNTFTVGISNQAVKGMTNFNIFNESSSSGGYTGGTISAAISISPTGGAIGNKGSVATGHLLAADGTTNVSYSQNFDGQAGGATAVTT